MDFDLSPNCPQKTLFDGEGGSYKAWSSSDLATAKVGGGELVLKPRGFALPHYADSSKFGYVLQGTEGIVGMVLPNTSKEVVLRLKKGDVIPVPLGGSSWWYNNGDSDFVIVFLGETSKAFVPGEFTYFLLSGTVGLVGGFSSEFTRQAYNLNEKEANKLAKNQTGMLIIKLEEGIRMPNPHDKDFLDKMLYNIDAAPADLEVPRAGVFKTLTAAKLQCLEQVGLSVSLVKLSANAMYSPTCTANGSTRLIYVAEGSGKVQMVGINGTLVLDTKIEAGQLFLVPRFFTVAEIAGSEGMKLLSMTNSTWPVIEEFATEKSVWNALSPIVAQVALNVTPEFEELFKSNINKSSIIIPPSN
ncbi:cocosin 1-like [Ricinus communis]|uniref:cocosin 1-like n=1 Tax=Ricinus communis TaxID=3988 RepID=UPI00201B15E0|nr:cocosin 1-like [Ricinus communis]